jgi:hypothetical protein
MTNVRTEPMAGTSYHPIPAQPVQTDPKEADMSAHPHAPQQYDPSPYALQQYEQSPYALLPQHVVVQTPSTQTSVTPDPGRTLGIVGLVLSVVANVVGLVVSTVAYRRSRRAGFRNGAALAGIVIGLVTTLGLVTASVVGGLAAKSVLDTCRELGPGQHVVNGITYTCG